MKYYLIGLLFFIFQHYGTAQTLEQSLKLLYLNLPFNDSIIDVVNGKYGHTFIKEPYHLPGPDTAFTMNDYVATFSNHPYLKDLSGEVVVKIAGREGRYYYSYLVLVEANKNSKLDGLYDSLITVFEEFGYKIHTLELGNRNGKIKLISTSIQLVKDTSPSIYIQYYKRIRLKRKPFLEISYYPR